MFDYSISHRILCVCFASPYLQLKPNEVSMNKADETILKAYDVLHFYNNNTVTICSYLYSNKSTEFLPYHLISFELHTAR